MIPLFPLRGGDVFFEDTIKTVLVGRPSTLATVKAAVAVDRQIAVFTLSQNTAQTPCLNDFFTIGVRAEVISMKELEPDRYAVTLSSVSLIQLDKVHCVANDVLMADVTPHGIQPLSEKKSALVDETLKALEIFCEAVGLPASTGRLVGFSLRTDINPTHKVASRLVGSLVNYVGLGEESHPFSTEQRLKLLEARSVEEQLLYLVQLLKSDKVRNQLTPGYAERVSVHIQRASEFVPPVGSAAVDFAAQPNSSSNQKRFDSTGHTHGAPNNSKGTDIVFHTEEALIAGVENALNNPSNPHAREMNSLVASAIQGDRRALVAALRNFEDPPPAFLLNVGEFAAAFLYYLAAQFKGVDKQSHELKIQLLNYGDQFAVPLRLGERGSRESGTELPKSRIISRLAREHCSFVIEQALGAFERGDFKQSAELYSLAGLTQYYPEALLGLGAAYDAQGKFKEAAQATRDFISRVATLPKDAYQREDLPKAHTNLACSLYSLGSLKEARLEVTRALELNSTDKEAQKLLRTIDAAGEHTPSEESEIGIKIDAFEKIALGVNTNPFTLKRMVSEFANFLQGRSLTQEQRDAVQWICQQISARRLVSLENMKGEPDPQYGEGVSCDEIMAALEVNEPFFISSLGIVLDFDDGLNEIDEQFVYVYFLNKIIFASKTLFSIVSIEDDGRTLDSSELKAALVKSRKLSECAEASRSGNLDQLLNDSSKMPWEHFRILARLPMKYGRSAFVFFSGYDLDKNLMIDAYCVKESAEEELGDVLKKLFGASDISFRGGPKSGHNPISTDNEAIEKLTLSIDSETHLHPDD